MFPNIPPGRISWLFLIILIQCSMDSTLEILFQDTEKLSSMPFIEGDIRQYGTCKGEQLDCAYKIFNKMSSYNDVSQYLLELK